MALIVNGEKIEDSVIQWEVERLRPDYERVFADQSPGEREAQLLDWSRENVIERVLINQEAKKDGQKIPQSQIEAALAEMRKQGRLTNKLDTEDEEKMKEKIELQLKVECLLADVCKDIPEPSDEAISRFYDENKKHFKSAEQIRAAHIVKYIDWHADERAAYKAVKKAQDELRSGAIFEMVVDKYTDCGDRGGDLGYVTRGQMVEEFEDVVFNLNVNEVSDIFRTRFGYHIAKVYGKKAAIVRGIEEVRSQIVKAIKEKIREEAIEGFVDRLKVRPESKK